MAERRVARALSAAVGLLGFLGFASPADGWLAAGHRRIAIAALRSLPPEVPLADPAAARLVGDLAQQVDLWTSRDAPTLRADEVPRHFVALERLPPGPLPRHRADLDAAFEGRETGSLPWTILEEWERLAIAFAVVRREPRAASSLLAAQWSAGRLAHFAADLAQPLHTTIHHDGWALPDGTSPASGAHYRIDALLDDPALDDAAVALSSAATVDVWQLVLGELATSHARLDETHRWADRLAAGEEQSAPELRAFACDRLAAGTRLVAQLVLAAWSRSAELDVPSWYAPATNDQNWK